MGDSGRRRRAAFRQGGVTAASFSLTGKIRLRAVAAGAGRSPNADDGSGAKGEDQRDETNAFGSSGAVRTPERLKKDHRLTTRDRVSRKRPAVFAHVAGFLTVALTTLTPSLTETAVANGDTRTIHLHHAHTQESISATYLVNGQYDSAVLKQLNWFLRDWRRDEPTNMDPRLFDVVWEAYRHAGAGNEVINVVSAYRSPETNAMLRSRSRAVAKYSQHMLGKAMDTTMPGMPMSHVREIGMRMQRGGVGYYPTAGTPFVHLDVGNVRSWPRMSFDQLARLFPDGKTVHLPTNGQPLARYEEARAEIEARGNGAYVTAPRRTVGGFFAMLFGGGAEEDEDVGVAAPAPSTRKQWASLAPRGGRGAKVAGAESDEEGGGAPAEPAGRRGKSQALARAEANLPRGETAMTTAPGEAVEPPAEQPDKAQDKASAARAPLPPPGRPASLDKLTPPETPTVLAAAEPMGTQELRSSIDFRGETAGDAAAEKAPQYANAPLPPRRPMTLVATASDAPIPPTRPTEMTRAAEADSNATHAIATLMDSANAGLSARQGQPDESPMAYAAESSETSQEGVSTHSREAAAKRAAGAPAGANAGAQKADFVPARLDRSNFRALTGATPTSRVSGASVMGSSIGAVRSVARAAEPSVLAPPRMAHVAGFATPTPAPPADKFAPGMR